MMMTMMTMMIMIMVDDYFYDMMMMVNVDLNALLHTKTIGHMASSTTKMVLYHF